ncbi:DUF962-domain-containing protein [Hymenopellis radicata]|nr:DUF962-domain-containing protein [Hymenopellis radicata]
MSSIFDIDKQFTFYGAYHTNRINVAIHICCVPLILWSGLVMGTEAPSSFLPAIHLNFNQYLAFDLNLSSIVAGLFLLYYYALEPLAAFIYTPFMTVVLLTALKFSHRPDHMAVAGAVHAFAWIAQFIGHGVAEKRAPALLDNILGAVVLAPFFVHLEVLYKLGYKPELHKRISNEIGKEVTRIRKADGERKRQAAAKKG